MPVLQNDRQKRYKTLYNTDQEDNVVNLSMENMKQILNVYVNYICLDDNVCSHTNIASDFDLLYLQFIRATSPLNKFDWRR
jgi:N-acetyl-anhydromuramyl-L-alanine amidase AmpD